VDVFYLRHTKVASEEDDARRTSEFADEVRQEVQSGGMSIYRATDEEELMVAALYNAKRLYPNPLTFFRIPGHVLESLSIRPVQVADGGSSFQFMIERHYELRDLLEPTLSALCERVAAAKGGRIPMPTIKRLVQEERKNLRVTKEQEWDGLPDWTKPSL
jgi:hypothetical protein